MTFYDVEVNNGESYEDRSYERYFIGAENEEEAEKIAIELFERNWRTARNVSVYLVSKTDNDIEVLISQK